MAMIDFIAAILILLGSMFIFVAALGLLRMPDLLMRMHAGTKAGTLGVSLILLAVAIHFMTVAVWTKALITIVFLFITIPIGAHMLGRAAYFINIPLWDQTVVDELRDHYNKQSHELE
jgi:multicomponent Na+:H+ antiporter subunit G